MFHLRLSCVRFIFRHSDVGINVFNQPLERLAFETISQIYLFTDITKVSLGVTNGLIIILLVTAEPHFG